MIMMPWGGKGPFALSISDPMMLTLLKSLLINVSRLNHSCAPNVAWSFDATKNVIEV